MKSLSPERIRKGRLLVSAAAAALLVLNLGVVVWLIALLGFSGVDSLYYWQGALFVVCTIGMLRGLRPVKYIFAFILVIGVIGNVIILAEGGNFTLFTTRTPLAILLVLETLARFLLIYFLMFDSRVEDFFLYQASLYQGKRVQVKPEDHPEGPEAEQKEKNPKAGQDKWDVLEDLDMYEEEKE